MLKTKFLAYYSHSVPVQSMKTKFKKKFKKTLFFVFSAGTINVEKFKKLPLFGHKSEILGDKIYQY